ncbi:TetR/AcrR family transcriptional regulator [Amycolatopsis anabasis]|uniref:TetR/AcrR family transcriptional regulator n=1 Tax=Amycolatopsis anabasis TaxID=1840409 RepID=UPI00131ADBC7|nr:TetR/AcrR family transcriptional regulator [Amycolatopsis anabasis]
MSPAKPGPRDTPRKQRAADAAIEVIATEGLRGLTHRAVDAKSGLPPGSTSSCFRTRLALLRAVLDRILELDQEMLAAIPVTGWRVDTAQQRAKIVDLFTDLLEYWLGPARHRTLARLELYLDAARRAELGPELAAANRLLLDRAATGMRAAGIRAPREAARIFVAQLDGLLYDALARPFLNGDDRKKLRHAVRVIVTGHIAAH